MDEFRLLGPLEVGVDGREVNLGGAKPRALLALLLLNRNHVVSNDRLIDELWGDEPPARATKTLQVYVSQLRKALGADRLVTRPPGYLVRVEPGELDLDRFEQLTAEARRLLGEGDAGGARDRFRDALRLWRGPPEEVAARLDDLRLAVYEDSLHAALQAGEAGELIPELEQLVRAYPVRERPRELLMLALYRAGRQADALELFRQTRELYVDELGIEPGERLRELERAMLQQDPALRAPSPPTREAAAAAPAAPADRPRLLVPIALAAAAAVAAAVLAVVLLRAGDESSTRASRGDPHLRSFVTKVENFLAQSHDGRVEVKRAITGALDCSLSPQLAAAQLDHVQRNRQSLLEQLAALHVPARDVAQRSSDLLQRAIQASIAADWIYRDWLRAQDTCPRGRRPPAAARATDGRATSLKRRFLRVFDPLARRFGKRVWRVEDF